MEARGMVNKRRIGLAAALAVAGLGTFVATGIGGSDGGLRDAPDATKLDAHRVAAPGGAAGKAVAHASAVKVIYKETNVVPVDGPQLVTVGKCPRQSGVVNGYYGRETGGPFGIDTEGGAPSGNLRKWIFVLGDSPATDAFFGLVCVKP
jgi:hypothetical protein